MKLLREYIRELLTEDSLSYIKDMVGAQESGEIDRDLGVTDWEDYEEKTNVRSKKAAISQSKQKDLFRKHADHQWLSSLNTVHWAMAAHADPYSLSKLGSKDELSATMSLPGESLRPYGRGRIGLWIKGRITWATNHQDTTWSGTQDDYSYTQQQIKSSGRNKRPMNIQWQFAEDWADVIESGEMSDRAKKSLPVLGANNWDPAKYDSNEALVDNWKAFAVVVKGDANEILNKFKSDPQGWEKRIRSIEGLAKSYGVPVVGSDRQLILPANMTMKAYLKKLGVK
jgi:hypothetical protein